jgi:hypothetical protein
MGNPVPSQIRSVDPYASYDSNVVNHLTRMISDGKNILLSPSPIDVSWINTTFVRVAMGKAIMDDVLIETTGVLDVDLSDIDFYISGGGWGEIGNHLIVLQYEYQKTSPPPVAEIKIITPSQKATLYDPTRHLFLKCIEVTNPGSGLQVTDPDSVRDYDPDNPSVDRTDLIAGASAGNFVATDKDTEGVGNNLYSVGTGPYDRFNKIWVKELMVETVTVTPPTSPPGSAVYGTALYGSGTYGDLAEKYTCDPLVVLEPGTVIEMSDGEYEVESCNQDLSPFVIGVISTEPAYILNSHLKDGALVGLVGRVPTKVVGPVKRKDIMVSAGNGCLRATSNPLEYYAKVGIALETSSDESIKLITCLIK